MRYYTDINKDLFDKWIKDPESNHQEILQDYLNLCSIPDYVTISQFKNILLRYNKLKKDYELSTPLSDHLDDLRSRLGEFSEDQEDTEEYKKLDKEWDEKCNEYNEIIEVLEAEEISLFYEVYKGKLQKDLDDQREEYRILKNKHSNIFQLLIVVIMVLISLLIEFT